MELRNRVVGDISILPESDEGVLIDVVQHYLASLTLLPVTADKPTQDRGHVAC